jgi:hypothetical protein
MRLISIPTPLLRTSEMSGFIKPLAVLLKYEHFMAMQEQIRAKEA